MQSRTGDDDANRYLLCIPTKSQLVRVLAYLFDENEFLSEFGIRSLSKVRIMAVRGPL